MQVLRCIHTFSLAQVVHRLKIDFGDPHRGDRMAKKWYGNVTASHIYSDSHAHNANTADGQCKKQSGNGIYDDSAIIKHHGIFDGKGEKELASLDILAVVTLPRERIGNHSSIFGIAVALKFVRDLLYRRDRIVQRACYLARNLNASRAVCNPICLMLRYHLFRFNEGTMSVNWIGIRFKPLAGNCFYCQ